MIRSPFSYFCAVDVCSTMRLLTMRDVETYLTSMQTIHLFLFGTPRLVKDNIPLTLNYRKALALLAYLAVTGQVHGRDTLATLLWPQETQAIARTYLRRELARLRKVIGADYFVADRETLGLNTTANWWVDVAAFQEHVMGAEGCTHDETTVCDTCLPHLQAAADYYRDDFLVGFTLPDSPDFDEWQFFQNEALRQDLVTILKRLCSTGQTLNDESSLPYARRWVALEPLSELAHRRVMQLYSQLGQQAAAMRQYDLCVQSLKKELGIAPAFETTALYEAIRQPPELDSTRIAEHYVLREHPKDLLGEGGMGFVYRGTDSRDGSPVAIKILKKELIASNPQVTARFIREGEALAQLNHPNIIALLATEQQEAYYLVLEYVGGGTLHNQLQDARKLSPDRVLEIGLDLADALARAHHLGIIHRDLKLNNVLLTEDGAVRLADFGIAQIKEKPSLTQTGMIMGTIDYLSPEACQGDTVDARTDIWSLGIILLELLTGTRPFSKDSMMGTLTAILQEPLPDLTRFPNTIPTMFQQLLQQMLEKERDHRLASMRQVAAALEAIHQGDERALQAVIQPQTPSKGSATLEKQQQQMAAAVSGTVQADSRMIAPPEPTHPPEIGQFIGRQTELMLLTDQLSAEHQVFISGMPGVGKTALAVTLAESWQRLQDNTPIEDNTIIDQATPEIIKPGQGSTRREVFWHTFHEGQGASLIIWKLAAFLAWHDTPEIWQMLQSAQETGSELPPTDMLYDYVLQAIREKDCLLCFDDFHYISDDPDTEPLLKRLLTMTDNGEIYLIITTRQVPDSISLDNLHFLAGISVADTQQWITVKGLNLTSAQATRLHHQTEGNAQFLKLALDALDHSRHPDWILARLVETDHIERFLLNEVDASVNDDERDILGTVALLLGYPSTRAVIETILDTGSLRRPLRSLVDRFLLFTQEGELDREYWEHGILRSFYYDMLSRRQRRQMHRLAAEYYETEEPNYFQAALHYAEAQEPEKAASLVCINTLTFINQGQARPLALLLNMLTEANISTLTTGSVLTALGEVKAFLQEWDVAKESYIQALIKVSTLSDSDNQALKARICRGVADILRNESLYDAKQWLEWGLYLLGDTDSEEKAALFFKLSTVQIHNGDYEAALATIQAGGRLLESDSGWLRLGILNNLGLIYWKQGSLTQAINVTMAGLDIGQRLSDYVRLTTLWNNLGMFKDEAGDWAGAIEAYEQALSQAEQLGNADYQITIASNLAVLYTQQGSYDTALSRLRQSQNLADQHDLQIHKTHIQSSLADLYIRQQAISLAEASLTEAEGLAKQTQWEDELVRIYRGWAQFYLLKQDIAPGLDYANQAVNISQGLGLPLEVGASLRVLAQAQLAHNQSKLAQATFSESLTVLEDQFPYEAALTQLAWGAFLIDDDDTGQGRRLLEKAQNTFSKLGANHDLT
ncbi:MAG: protein kinase, partial [Chloroflexota bacterium]